MKINNLKISTNKKILVNFSFEVKNSLALVGQSGSGKSLTLKALLGMLPSNLHVKIDAKADFDLKAGKTISLVPQNPFTALSPLTKIKKHFLSDEENIKKLFEQVGLEFPLANRYPPELSGGQLQRVVIAIALESNPKLLLLDEPTTALDPATKEKILLLLKQLQKQNNFKMLFVTHDILSAALVCEDVCVIKEGNMVEYGKIKNILKNPKELYTKTLIEANFHNREFRR